MQTDLPDILAQYAPNTPSYKEKFGANTNRQKSCIKEISDYFLKSCLTSTVCINFANADFKSSFGFIPCCLCGFM